MIITVSLIVVAIIFFASFLNLAGIKLIGKKSNPFGLFCGLNFFLVSLPGIFLVYSPTVDTFLNSGFLSVSNATIKYVTYSYLFSLCIIITLILFASYIFRGFYLRSSYESNYHQKKAIGKFIKFSVILNMMYIFALFLKIGINNIPLIVSFRGDLVAAQILKAQLITGEISKLPEFLNQIFRILIPLVPFMAANQVFSQNGSKKHKWTLILSFLAAAVYYTYDLQKAPLFLFVFGLMFIHAYHRGLRWKILIIIPMLIIALLGINAFYFNITNLNDIMFLIEKVVTRLFIMQNQGMYYIVEHIKPDTEFLKTGAILSSFIFSDLPERPSSIVMKIMYGYSAANVNMNTYFLGQAYSSAGTIGVILSSLIIGSHLCIYLVIFKKLYKKNIEFFMPLSVVFYLFFIPINQGFNSFLYGRNAIFFIVFGFFVYLLYSMFIVKPASGSKVS